MKSILHTAEHIISILKTNKRGVCIDELDRQYGVTEQTIYRWKAKYGGMKVSGRNDYGSWRQPLSELVA
ncbi:transposase [Halomonas sp. CS7]|uniref:Transposase n=1 Tax=Halomonas pelophila TaxID=3151122 RepID=A0ABV1N8N9_9GAMM